MKKMMVILSVLLPLRVQSEELQTEALTPFPSVIQEIVEGKFLLGSEMIHSISSFNEIVYLTTYSYEGNPIWELPFSVNIISWELKGGNLFVFSKNRLGTAFFLTCINAANGQVLWERAIVAPTGL